MIEIKCSCENTLKLSDLSNFQGDLKTLSDNNYRKLKAQIERHGFIVPFFVWKKGKKNYILDGHQRETVLTRMKAEGIDIPDEFPVVFVDADNERDAKEKLLAINSQYGTMTETGLFDFIKEDFEFGDLSDFTLPVDMNILESMFEPMEDEHTEEELEHIPDMRETDIVTGDMFKLGRHRLLCGDCTKIDDVEKLMEGKKADMVFTDPPYGINYEYKGYKDVEGEEYLNFCEEWFNILLKYSNLIFITTGWRYEYFWYSKNPDDKMIWFDKTKQSGGRSYFLRKTEPIFIFGKVNKKFDWDILEFSGDRDGLRELHSCPKPISLVKYIIEKQSVKNNIVMDFFLGSGTTLIACEETGRTCYGIEIEPQYCQVIIDRWEKLTGKKAERI